MENPCHVRDSARTAENQHLLSRAILDEKKMQMILNFVSLVSAIDPARG